MFKTKDGERIDITPENLKYDSTTEISDKTTKLMDKHTEPLYVKKTAGSKHNENIETTTMNNSNLAPYGIRKNGEAKLKPGRKPKAFLKSRQ